MKPLDWVELLGLMLAWIDFLDLTPRLENFLDRLRVLLREFLDLCLRQPYLLVFPGLFLFAPIFIFYHEPIWEVVPHGEDFPFYLAPLIGLALLACYLGTGWIAALVLGCLWWVMHMLNKPRKGIVGSLALGSALVAFGWPKVFGT